MSDDLIQWFAEENGFSQGRKAPHKWVLQAEQEMRIQSTALTEAQATIARQQELLNRALESNGDMMVRIGKLEEALREIVEKDDAGDMMYRADGPFAKIARAALAHGKGEGARLERHGKGNYTVHNAEVGKFYTFDSDGNATGVVFISPDTPK